MAVDNNNGVVCNDTLMTVVNYPTDGAIKSMGGPSLLLLFFFKAKQSIKQRNKQNKKITPCILISPSVKRRRIISRHNRKWGHCCSPDILNLFSQKRSSCPRSMQQNNIKVLSVVADETSSVPTALIYT